jgi:predicted nucleic acid-binding protein
VIVLDSSATVHLFANLTQADWVRGRLDVESVHAPYLLDIEVANALRGLVARRELAQADARRALEDYADVAVRRYPHALFLDRIWQLRTHVTAYDAVYIALAEALDAPLVTTDLRLARTHGHRARIVTPE